MQLTTDGNRVKQIIINLVSNAIKYTEEGAVTVHVTIDTHHVIKAVRDTGVGIEPS